MKERPILMSGPLVVRTLDDVNPKTMTRRVVKPLPTFIGGRGEEHIPSCWGWETECGAWITMDMEMPRWRGGDYHRNSELTSANCPYGEPGDRLWVREMFRFPSQVDKDSPAKVGASALDANYPKPWCPTKYQADGTTTVEGQDISDWGDGTWGKGRPSIFMPRWASRIDLEVVAVRVERVQAITSSDALAEGIQEYSGCENQHDMEAWDPVDEFRKLWDSINGKRPGCAWSDDPWTWCIEYKRVRP